MKKMIIILFSFMIMGSFAFYSVRNVESESTILPLNTTMTTIIFVSNGGTAVSPFSGLTGSNITEPATPQRNGYAFAGWYLDDGTFLNRFTFSVMPSENITLYAKWIELEPVLNFDSLVSQLPEVVTISHRIAIETAQEAYDSLSADQKALSNNYQIFLIKEKALEELEKQVAKVIQMIDNLSCPISYNDKDDVLITRAAYEALADDQKVLVTNYVSLWDAERRVLALEAEAQLVVDMIEALPTDISLSHSSAVSQARTAFDALSICQQSFVHNYPKLASAEDAIRELKKVVDVANLIALIDSLPSDITYDEVSIIREARQKYGFMSSDQRSQIVNYAVLVSAERVISDIETAMAFEAMVLGFDEIIELNDQNQIEAARIAYLIMNQNQKAYVSPQSVIALEIAIAKIDELLLINHVIQLIGSIEYVEEIPSQSQVIIAREAYDALSEDQQMQVTNYEELLNAETLLDNLQTFNPYWFSILLVIPTAFIGYLMRFKIIGLFKRP